MEIVTKNMSNRIFQTLYYLISFLATTHNLKICKDKKTCQCSSKTTTTEKATKIINEKENESSRVIGLQNKIKDMELLYKESLSVIQNLHCEIEERNKKILKLELSHKAQIVTEKDKPFKPRIEMTSLISKRKEFSLNLPNISKYLIANY